MQGMSRGGTRIEVASGADRDTISRMRHSVYAEELGQHAPNAARRLTDACDGHNLYLVARVGDEIAGFISVTPPSHEYAIEKYLRRTDLPFPVTDSLYEVRLLTVRGADRGGGLAALLMYAAFRLVEERGGTRVLGMGRLALRPLYEKAGLHFLGVPVRSGAVAYELMGATTAALRAHWSGDSPLLRRLRRGADWVLPFPFEPEAACAHGGASIGSVGDDFGAMERRHGVVSADVLDAWFPPAPGVIAALQDHLPWLLQTSPPAEGAGLVRALADARGVPPGSLTLGAGSSALIYLALRHWLSPAARVLLPDPTYGEYAHVLERVIGCRVSRLALPQAEGYRLDLERLRARLRRAADGGTPYDLVILVNPNNPAGPPLPRLELEALLAEVAPPTRVWVDEAYVEYLGVGQSLEPFAARSRDTVVCKSLSKCYALSGARVAYLCGPAPLMRELRRVTPPWAVSLPAQVAALAALRDPNYYRGRYEQTEALRGALVADLRRSLPTWDVRPSPANWVLCHLPPAGPDAATVAARCRSRGVFLRDAASISPRLGTHALRVAVKDVEGNARIVSALTAAGESH